MPPESADHDPGASPDAAADSRPGEPRVLVCLYTCSADQAEARELEDTALMRHLRADPRFRVLEVHADERLGSAILQEDRLTLACAERYGNLSVKTHRMVQASLELDYDVLLKIDGTLASYARRRHNKSAGLLERLSPDAALSAIEDPAFFAQPYNGLVSQSAGESGFSAWMETKGLACNYRNVFEDGRNTPPYFLGKFYSLRRDFCTFIAEHGAAMAEQHARHLGGSEDIMIGRLHEGWREQTSSRAIRSASSGSAAG